MIKLALKHWIFEKCIDMVFDNIENNFTAPHNSIMQVGDCFSYIKLWDGTEIYNGVFVKPTLIIFNECTYYCVRYEHLYTSEGHRQVMNEYNFDVEDIKLIRR